MKEVKWGILGAGGIANQFVEGLSHSKTGKAVAVASRSGAKAENFAKTWGIEKAYSSYEEMVSNPDLDMIYIATPNALHHDHGLMCLNAGKGILCEKPFALSLHEAQEVTQTARDKNLFCMEAMWMRFNPLIKDVIQKVENQQIGEVVGFSGNLAMAREIDESDRFFAKELGGGAMLDLGVYPLSLIQRLGKGPWHVSSHITTARTGVDTHTTVTLSNSDGQHGQIMASFLTDSDGAFEIYGTKGTIRIHGPIYRPTSYDIRLHQARPSAGSLVTESKANLKQKIKKVVNSSTILTKLKNYVQAKRLNSGGVRVTIPYEGNGYHYQADEIARCLAAGKIESDQMPHKDTLETMQLLESILKAPNYEAGDKK